MELRHEIVERDQIRLIGAAIRTSNERGAEIGAFWQGLFAGGHFDRIPNKASDDVFGVYTQYESDHTGAYTLLAGCAVTSFDELPDGMRTLVIRPARYARFELPDATPDSIVAAWMHIWGSELEPRRAYEADFDRTFVGPDGVARAETYVGVR